MQAQEKITILRKNGLSQFGRNPSHESWYVLLYYVEICGILVWSYKKKEVSGVKLQIIDRSESFCKAVVQLLPDAFETDFFTDGRGAATRICSFRPDILVLSASLPGNDGFHILRMAQSMGVHPMVLMIVPVITDYAKEQAAKLKVDYAMCMPCNISAVADCILRLRERLVRERNPVQDNARSFLMDLNFRTNLCGYRYLMDAFSILLQNPEQSFSKELYPAVAKRYNGTWQQIERGIRESIKTAWENREGEAWMLYFPYQKTKPSNTVFLARGIQCLQELAEEAVKA